MDPNANFSSEMLSQLKEALQRELSLVESIDFKPSYAPSSSMLALIALNTATSDFSMLTEKAVRVAERFGVSIVPVFMPPHNEGRPKFVTRVDEWFAALHASSTSPTSIRTALLHHVRTHRAVIEIIHANNDFCSHLALGLAAETLRQMLDLVFAIHGESFTHNPKPFETFERFHDSTISVDRSCMVLYFRLLGLAAQERHDAFAQTSQPLEAWPDLFAELDRFFNAFERDIKARFTTETERRRKTRIQLVASGAAALVAIVVAIVVWIKTRPELPLNDPSLSQRAGGILGEYYNGENFDELIEKRLDTLIGFRTDAPPLAKLDKDHFSIRWNGYVRFPRDGAQYICTENDDGARLFFNNRLVVNDWNKHGTQQNCAKVRVKAGWYPIRIEYFDFVSTAVMRLLYGDEEERVRLVSSADLCCTPTQKKTIRASE